MQLIVMPHIDVGRHLQKVDMEVWDGSYKICNPWLTYLHITKGTDPTRQYGGADCVNRRTRQRYF